MGIASKGAASICHWYGASSGVKVSKRIATADQKAIISKPKSTSAAINCFWTRGRLRKRFNMA